MSEQRQGGSGDRGGRKGPRATFGDVMLGIPAGRGGERDRGEQRGRERREGHPRKERERREVQATPQAEAQAPEAAAAKATPSSPPGTEEATTPREERGKRRERGQRREKERKSQGPLVVVKRASGAVETRPLAAAGGQPGNGEERTEAPAPLAETPPPAEEKPEAAPSRALDQEVPEAQSFQEMFEQSVKAEGAVRRHYRVGERVTGTIFQLGAETAFLSLGGKSEAMIDLGELKDAEGILRHGVGDQVEAFVVEAGAKGLVLSRKMASSAASLAMLAQARATGVPVEGLVLAVNKGGLEVAVGDLRAFCPAGQVDLRFVGQLDQFVGEKHLFRVLEVRERNVVLSRRALMEEEQRVRAAETRKHLAEGKLVKGKISSVRDFGAFVDLGGIEGLIPLSELSHARVGHPGEVVKVGDEVEAEVLKIEPPRPDSPDKAKQKERITLSLRARQADPWQLALEELKEGERVKGKVVRLQPFGAFVELRPGVDGLIHVSALSNRRVAHPKDVVQVGQEVTVQVEKVDPAERRIGLRLVAEGEVEQAPVAPAEVKKEVREAARPKVGQVVIGKIDRIEPYGVFLAFPGGKGLVPASETGTERGTEMRRAFQLGQELKAEILEIDSSGKIRLSVAGAQRAEERAEMEQWRRSQSKGAGGKGFGTLADLLKGRKL